MYTNKSFDEDAIECPLPPERNIQTSDGKNTVQLQVEEGITFSWHNISVKTKESTTGKCCGLLQRRKVPAKTLLNNVSGLVRPGELLAIMGASGAGKSTLLNTLLFRNVTQLKVSGQRIANRSEVTPNSLTALSGYVQQDDLFIGTLTVREHLTFQATVRMDSSIPMKRRMERVSEVIKALGLSKAENTVIGISGRIKGISGGEMKRLAVASEVLTNPSLLFLDEPTSGLDSFMAASIMDMLGDLAKEGRTVICTIHQPSSQIFAKIDQLLLLAEGRVAYQGQASQALDFFQGCGYECPSNYNPSDYFIEMLAIQPGIEDECRDRVEKISSAYNQSKQGKQIMSEVETNVATLDHTDQKEAKSRSPYKVGLWTQFRALTWRSWLSVVKEPLLVKVKFIQSVVLALILGLVYYQQDLDPIGVQNLVGACFVLLTNVSFSNIFSVVNVFCAELPIMLREHFNGMYRVGAYFVAKQLVEIPFLIIFPMMFVVIFYFMVGLDRTAEKFFYCVLIVLLVVQAVVGFGYLISSIAPSVDVALAIGPLILIPFMLLGGFFINTDTVPVWLDWLKYLSWFMYGMEALMINQWVGLDLDCPSDGMMNTTMRANPVPGCMDKGDYVLDNLKFNKDNFTRDLLVLGALAIGMRILSYMALLVKSRRKT